MSEEKNLFEKGDFKIKFEGGNLVFVLDTKGADVSLKVESAYFVDLLEAAIPGDQKIWAEMLKASIAKA